MKNPPSTTTPSLSAGYPVRNALLTLETQLKKIDHIQEKNATWITKNYNLRQPQEKQQCQEQKNSLNMEASPRVEKTPAASRAATVPRITKSLNTEASPRVEKNTNTGVKITRTQ